jgi:hypothetical protein
MQPHEHQGRAHRFRDELGAESTTSSCERSFERTEDSVVAATAEIARPCAQCILTKSRNLPGRSPMEGMAGMNRAVRPQWGRWATSTTTGWSSILERRTGRAGGFFVRSNSASPTSLGG